ncbi:hypothetical protein LCGC14_0537440 [marine sediment metagenome]|uniref:Uncharacterized protein n=1 Tax=marine sediment metagenome TaxID=412755 RepID=A0A0F9RYL0_9ZZZZ
MDSTQLEKVTTDLKKKYPEVGIQKIEVDESSGKSTFFLTPNDRVLASLPDGRGLSPRMARASTLRRDVMDRTTLDLAKTSPSEENPQELYKRAIKYYYENDFYGSHIDVLTNFASKGFENDIDDEELKLFYDVWNFDVGFDQMLNWMFFDFFRVGLVRTYKIVGKYEPGISYLSAVPGQRRTKQEKGILKGITERAARIRENKLKVLNYNMSLLDGRKPDQRELKKELAAKKNIWSKGFMPISYTILNPLLIEIEGSLLFNKSKVSLTPSAELRDLLTKDPGDLTEDEKLIIKLLPSDFKLAVSGGGKIELDPLFVGAVDYRKQPYERYPKPRGIKVFDSLEYKNSLREADLSTLDGISNYILKITVGNDDYPCIDQTQLETVSQLFNTTSKSFDVVWNHTLQIEKIVSPEIEAILGQGKYDQVNKDITGGLAFSRAFIDGTGDNVNQAETGLMVKTMIEEINYARRQVTQWIYHEYQQIAEAAGFDRFPKVRWDNTILRDIILYMATISQLVDRRMLSYETALEQLGFDFPNEFNNMQNEFPSVMDGTLGIIGSPFQQSATQPTGAPKGTPSSGRPKGKPAKKKQPNTKPATKTKVPNQSPSNQPKPSSQAASINMNTVMANAAEIMDEEQFQEFLEGFLEEMRNDNQ